MPVPVDNPRLRFARAHLELEVEAPPADLEVHEEVARSIVSRNESPDVGFRCSVNPYRGCFHACAYCYARPTHAYLDLGAGTDFDRKLVAKINAPELLREAFAKPSWTGETIAFSGNTDCYQPIEAHYELTRRCLEVCLEHRNPVGVITKSVLVRRDAELLAELGRVARASVAISIPFSVDADARAIEPFASPPSKRFETIRILADLGLEVTVAVAPILPGFNDAQIPTILARAAEAGARRAFMVLLRLPLEVAPVFEQRLRAAFPLRADKVLAGVRAMRGGAAYEARFGDRMRGEGERWHAVEQLFAIHAARHGLEVAERLHAPEASTFVRAPRQLRLF